MKNKKIDYVRYAGDRFRNLFASVKPQHLGLFAAGVVSLLTFFGCKDDQTSTPMTIPGTSIEYAKTGDVSSDQMNRAMQFFNDDIYATLNDNSKNKFKNGITKILVAKSGTPISHTGTVLTMAWDADEATVFEYLAFNNMV